MTAFLRCTAFSLLLFAAVPAVEAQHAGEILPTVPKPPPKPKPKQKTWEVSGSVGFSQTNGNANALATNLSNKVKYSLRGWAVVQDLAFFYGEANEKVNTNFWNAGLRGERTVADRIALFVASRFDRNALQGIEGRYQQGFGVEIGAIEQERHQLKIALGGSFFDQQLTPGSVARKSRAFPAARAAFDYRHRFSEKGFVQQAAEYLPAIDNDANSYFLNTESSVVAPISKSIALKISYVIRYNSEPPIRDDNPLRTTDTFFSSGVTLNF